MTRTLVLLIALGTIPWLACDGGGDGGTMDVTPGPGEDSLTPGVDSIPGVDTTLPGEDAGAELPPACENECGFFGDKACVGETGWHECVPEGTCLAWSAETVCDAGTSCVDAECVALFGDLDCLGITGCMGQCDDDEACQQACYEDGSEQGQAHWADLAVCVEGQCGDLFDAQKPAAGGKCTLEACKDQYLVCTPVGTASCSESLQCLQGCGGDNACLADCALAADDDALVELADILVCFEEKCPDPAEWEGCATTSCLGPVLGCL